MGKNANDGAAVSLLPTDYDARKALPLAAVLDYFPLAIAEVSKVIGAGQAQHGTTGWDRAKSRDDESTLLRHFMDRGGIDTDGIRHSAKMAWRALALLEKEIEAALGAPISRGSYDSREGYVGPGVRACEECEDGIIRTDGGPHDPYRGFRYCACPAGRAKALVIDSPTESTVAMMDRVIDHAFRGIDRVVTSAPAVVERPCPCTVRGTATPDPDCNRCSGSGHVPVDAARESPPRDSADHGLAVVGTPGVERDLDMRKADGSRVGGVDRTTEENLSKEEERGVGSIIEAFERIATDAAKEVLSRVIEDGPTAERVEVATALRDALDHRADSGEFVPHDHHARPGWGADLDEERDRIPPR